MDTLMWSMPELESLLEQFSEMNTRWPEAPTAPLWDTTEFLKLGTQSAQQGCPSNYCWFSSIHSQGYGSVAVQHNFTAASWWNYSPWNVLWGLERMATTHKRLQTKREQCSHDRDPGTLSEMKKGRLSLFVGSYEKAGSSILLMMVLRPGVLQNTPTKEMR